MQEVEVDSRKWKVFSKMTKSVFVSMQWLYTDFIIRSEIQTISKHLFLDTLYGFCLVQTSRICWECEEVYFDHNGRPQCATVEKSTLWRSQTRHCRFWWVHSKNWKSNCLSIQEFVEWFRFQFFSRYLFICTFNQTMSMKLPRRILP